MMIVGQSLTIFEKSAGIFLQNLKNRCTLSLLQKSVFEGSPFSVLRTSFPRRGQEKTVEQQLPLPPLGERD